MTFSLDKISIIIVRCTCHGDVAPTVELQNIIRTCTHVFIVWMVECITRIMDYWNSLMEA